MKQQHFADVDDSEIKSERQMHLKIQYLQGFKDGVESQREFCTDTISREEAVTVLRADPSFICTSDKNVAITDILSLPSVISGASKVEKQYKDLLDKIKDYVNFVKYTGLGKKKSLEFIEKYIDGLRAESEGKDDKKR